MAKVISPFTLRGSIGDLCFFENEFGAQVKEKGGPTAWQVKHLDRFTNTRRNAAEWQRVTAASQLLRRAMGTLLLSVRSMRLSGRMNGLLLETLRTDRVHDWGERVVNAGDLSVLMGFEFNRDLRLEDALPVNPAHCYSVAPGKVVVNIPAFRLRHKKGLPIEATHYRLVSWLVTVDFEKGTFTRDPQMSALHARGNKAGAAFQVEHVVPPDQAAGSFWLLGIEFYKLVNQRPVLVRGGALRMIEWIRQADITAVVDPSSELTYRHESPSRQPVPLPGTCNNETEVPDVGASTVDIKGLISLLRTLLPPPGSKRREKASVFLHLKNL